MRFGVHLPQWGRDATRAGVLAVAGCAEHLGFDAVWVADHIVHPTESSSRYPYRPEGVPFSAADGFLEALTTLAVVAGATERIGLGTSVLVLPMRQTLLTAKVVATLDVLSRGRVTLALGAGWWAEEFAALGATFEDRGKRFDEQLSVLRALWRHGTVEHHGHHVDFEEIACLPRPTQEGGPRLLVGGRGKAAWRRAATLADGWHAVGADVGHLEEGRREIGRLSVAAGRDPEAVVLSTSIGVGASEERALERLRRISAAGVANVVVNFGAVARDADALCAAMERFAAGVLPRLGGEGGLSKAGQLPQIDVQ